MLDKINDNISSVAISPIALGSKIRALRQRQKRTLDAIAATAGISKPFLSQIERGRATPSLTSLDGIAKSLGVAVQYFLDTPSEARSVCRADQLKYFGLPESANLFAHMTNLSDARLLDPILVRMPRGEKRAETIMNAGEKFLYVVAGQIALTLDEETHVLRTGDSAHYDATVPHSWANTGDAEAIVMCVGTPRLL
jgi:transcriptional regulator with XRE-family HTH domain